MITMRRGIALGIVAYLVFLIFSAPASLAVGLMQKRIPDLQVVAVQGSVWSGRANRLNFQRYTITGPKWSWRPLAMLIGRVEYALTGSWAGEPVALKAGSSLTGSVYLADVSATVAAQSVLDGVFPTGVSLQGQLIMELEKVDISEQGRLPVVEGKVSWPGAQMMSPFAIQFGDVMLDLVSGEQATLGKLTAQNGQLLIDGELEIAMQGDYTLQADIRANGQLPPAVSNGLNTFAEFENGKHRLDLSGNILSLLP